MKLIKNFEKGKLNKKKLNKKKLKKFLKNLKKVKINLTF